MIARSVILVLLLIPIRAVGSPVIVSLRLPDVVASDLAARRIAIASAREAVLSDHEIAPKAVWTNIAGFAADLTPEMIETLLDDERILSIDPDFPGAGALVESSALIGSNAVRSMGLLGRGVTAAVLDSGLDLTHPDFAGRIANEQCFCRNSNGSGCCPNGQTSQSGPGAGADDHGHGTNVTGILASAGVVSHPGVAPAVRLVVVKVLDSQNRFAGFSQVMSGLDWVVTNHPEVRVVNMSLLTSALFASHCDGSFAAFAGLVDALRLRGGLVFACSGNNGSLTSVGSPACISRVVSVGAVHDTPRSSFSAFGCTDAPASPDQTTCFTNRNATIDLLGPGAAVTASGRGGGLSTFTGTSQATPHAAGAAAVLWEVNPVLSADAVEAILKDTGRIVSVPPDSIPVPRIDLPAAVQRARPVRGPRRRAVAR